MRYETQTVRIGEKVSAIDWTWFDDPENWGHNRYAGHRDAAEMLERDLRRFREMVEGVEAGETWQATTDGGWPRVGWQQVIDVGMYDGWPYWKPTPSYFSRGPLGGEWHSVGALSDAERVAGALRQAQNGDDRG